MALKKYKEQEKIIILSKKYNSKCKFNNLKVV